MIARVPFFETSDPFVNLPQNFLPRESTAWAKTPVIAERAPANCDSSVDVRAGKACVDTYFLHPVPENPPQMEVKGMVSQP